MVKEPSGALQVPPGLKTASLLIDAPPTWKLTLKSAIVPNLGNVDLNAVPLERSPKLQYQMQPLLEGRVFDVQSVPPAGLTLELFSPDQQRLSASCVMGTAAYVQLPGGPVSNVKIGKDDADHYRLLHTHGHYCLTSLGSNNFRLTVVKNSLEEKSAQTEDNTIHVFTIAAGQVYERLLLNMITSVRSTSKAAKIKFWIVGEFLSPSFPASLGKLKEYFNRKKTQIDYQIVTYRWPAWLQGQHEKHRQVWAYKILFLDVLFEPSVKRIVYIDADQQVQSDIEELWKTDMEGRVYGFVPFCQDRPDTLGYQFWRKGYWKEHLKGKPYHIR